MSRFKKFILIMISTFFSLLPVISHAHVINHSTTFTDGFLHPLISFNHLLMIIVAGLFSAQLITRKFWLWPICFIYLLVIHMHIDSHNLFTHLSSLSYDIGFCLSTTLEYAIGVLVGGMQVKQRHAFELNIANY